MISISYWIDGVMRNLSYFFKDTTARAPFPVNEYEDTFAFNGLQLCTAGLRKCSEQIFTPTLKDCCEHLLNVADEVLTELIMRRDGDRK
jgi:hypothetical protein